MPEEDQPKQPEPEIRESGTAEPEIREPETRVPPVSRPQPSASNTTLQQVTQTLQQGWQRAQPILRTQSIKALRNTIQTLEVVLEKLETQQPELPASQAEALPSQPSTLSESAAQATTTTPPGQSSPSTSSVSTQFDLVATATRLYEQAKPWLARLRPLLAQLQTRWTPILAKIRDRLPESLSQKLSDRALTGAIAGLAFFLFWTTTSILSPGKPKPPEVARVPISQRVPPSDLVAPAELSAPDASQPVEVLPPPVESPALVLEPPAIAEALPEIPAAPSVTPRPPAPVPVVELTPEQKRIASIQEQVTEVTSPYAESLVQSIQLNFSGSRLTVKVTSGWYDLDSDQQDKLSNAMLQRALDLDFSKLEIVDLRGALLARSPVVGSNMVILKRQELIAGA